MRPTRTDLVEHRERAIKALRDRAYGLRQVQACYEQLAEAIERIPPVRQPELFMQAREELQRHAEAQALRAFDLYIKVSAAADQLEDADL